MKLEYWSTISGYENYEVSNLGRVRSIGRYRKAKGGGRAYYSSKILAQVINSRDYNVVTLHNEEGQSTKRVHRLVLEAHVGPCPEGLIACHGPAGRRDNSVSNLRWGTPSDNMYDRVRDGTDFNKNKTRCTRGHLYVGDNLYISKSGSRKCRSCQYAVRKAKTGCVSVKELSDLKYKELMQ